MYIRFFNKKYNRVGPGQHYRAEATAQARHDVLGSYKHYVISETTLAQWTPWCLRLMNWMEQQ
jgi:hypothetical protein